MYVPIVRKAIGSEISSALALDVKASAVLKFCSHKLSDSFGNELGRADRYLSIKPINPWKSIEDCAIPIDIVEIVLKNTAMNWLMKRPKQIMTSWFSCPVGMIWSKIGPIARTGNVERSVKIARPINVSEYPFHRAMICHHDSSSFVSRLLGSDDVRL